MQTVRMRQFNARMFPNTVVITKMTTQASSQHGYNPVPVESQTYQASVQDLKSMVADGGTGLGFSPNQTIITYAVFLPKVDGDTFIPSLQRGDQMTFDGQVYNIQAPPRNRGGYNVLWRIDLEQVS